MMYTASRDALVNVFEVSGASAASTTASSGVQGGARSVRPVQSLQGHVDWVNDVVGLGDGLVATCSSDTTCRVWREDGTSRCLSGHSDYVRGLCVVVVVVVFLTRVCVRTLYSVLAGDWLGFVVDVVVDLVWAGGRGFRVGRGDGGTETGVPGHRAECVLHRVVRRRRERQRERAGRGVGGAVEERGGRGRAVGCGGGGVGGARRDGACGGRWREWGGVLGWRGRARQRVGSADVGFGRGPGCGWDDRVSSGLGVVSAVWGWTRG